MLDSIDNGEWFIPSCETTLPGRLFFNDKENKITLETFGNKYLSGEPMVIIDPERDKKYHSKNYNHSYQERYPLINGNTIGKITLYNCRWAGTEDIGKELYIVKYDVQFVFWGVHVKSVNDFYIKSATLQYPYLGSWYDGWEAQGKMEIFENNNIGSSGHKNNLDEISPISIPEGPDIFIYDSFSKRMETIGVHHSMKYQKLLKFEYKNSILFKDLITDIFNFNRLLEFSHGSH